jgi:hypothetical protein
MLSAIKNGLTRAANFIEDVQSVREINRAISEKDAEETRKERLARGAQVLQQRAEKEIMTAQETIDAAKELSKRVKVVK